MTSSPDSLPASDEFAGISESVEPLREWVLLQPSADDERAGRIILPATVGARLQRSMVLAVGEDVSGLNAGDIVLALSNEVLDLRDGSQLAPHTSIIARIQ